jgi:hypothetical protein
LSFFSSFFSSSNLIGRSESISPPSIQFAIHQTVEISDENKLRLKKTKDEQKNEFERKLKKLMSSNATVKQNKNEQMSELDPVKEDEMQDGCLKLFLF